MKPRSPSHAALLSTLGAFLILTPMTCPGMYWGESSVLTARAWQLGGSHPPGYGAFLHGLHLIQKILPLGDIAFRSNIFSIFILACVAGALTLFLMKIKVPAIIAVPESLAFTLVLPVLHAAVSAEVYSLNLLLLMAVLILLIDPECNQQKRYLAVFLAGCALVHHMTFLLVLPGLTGLYFFRGKLNKPFKKCNVAGPVFLILGCSTLLFFPIRESDVPRIVWGDASNWRGFLTLITASEETSGSLLSGLTAPGDILRRAGRIAKLIRETLTLPGLLLVIPGAMHLLQDRRRLAACMGIALVLMTAAVVVYNSNETTSFYLPGLLFFWILSVLGLNTIILWLRRSRLKTLQITASVLLLLPLAMLCLIVPRAVCASPIDNHIPGRLARYKMNHLNENALTLCRRSDICFQNWYLTDVEHRNQNHTIFQHLLSFSWYLADLAREDMVHPRILAHEIEDSHSWNAAATSAVVLENMPVRQIVVSDPEIIRDMAFAGMEHVPLNCLPFGAVIASSAAAGDPPMISLHLTSRMDAVTAQQLISEYYRQCRFFAICGMPDKTTIYQNMARELDEFGREQKWW